MIFNLIFLCDCDILGIIQIAWNNTTLFFVWCHKYDCLINIRYVDYIDQINPVIIWCHHCTMAQLQFCIFLQVLLDSDSVYSTDILVQHKWVKPKPMFMILIVDTCFLLFSYPVGLINSSQNHHWCFAFFTVFSQKQQRILQFKRS